MAYNSAFEPMGKTFKIAAPTANTAVTIPITSDSPCRNYMVSCHTDTTKPAYVRISTSNVAASLPTVSGEYAMLVPPSARMVLTGPQVSSTTTVYVSMIGENNNAEIYVTPGEGI